MQDLPGLSERRQSPRHEVELDVDVVLDNGDIFTVKTRNISACGMHILCDSWVTDAIEPRGIQSHATNHIRFKIVASLAITGTDKKLYASCRIISVQRLSQDEYMLNLAFADFQNGSDTHLDDYLAQFEKKKVIKLSSIVA